MDENKKLNILKDRKLDRQEKNKSGGTENISVYIAEGR